MATLPAYLFFCGQKHGSLPIKRLQYIGSLPYLSYEGVVTNLVDTFNIYVQGEYLIYTNENTVITKTEIKKISTNYFGMKKEKDFGFFYNKLDTKNGRKMIADSFLSVRNMKLCANNFKLSPTDSLIKRIYKKHNVFERELYLPQEKVFRKLNINNQDSLAILYDDKLNWTNLSISRNLDSLSNSKVTKIILYYGSHFYPEHKIKMPEHYVLIQFTEQPLDIPVETINALFDRTRKAYNEAYPK